MRQAWSRPEPVVAGAPSSGVAPSPTFVPVAEAGALTGDGPYAVSAGGIDLVLVRTMGKLRAFEGHCPHQGALLGEGEIHGDVLVCRNHRQRFSIRTGACLDGPEGLVSCPVMEREGHVLVDLAPAFAAAERSLAQARRSIDDLPGPRGLPLVGNAHQIQVRRLHRILEAWAARYGPLYAFRLGPRRAVVVTDPRTSVQVLRARPDAYRRISNVEAVFREMGIAGVFSAEGAAWRSQRRLAMEALTPRHLPSFYPTLRTVADRLRRRLEDAAARDEPIDVLEELKRFTVDVTTALTFGHDVNTIEQPGEDVIQRRLELVLPAVSRRTLALVPLWRFIRLPRDRRLDRALAELRVWLDGLVREARARLEADPSHAPSNFMEAMLVARDEEGRPFSDQMIFGNLVTMLVAGEDTSAETLAWAVHHLCESAPSVRLLREELDRILGQDAIPGDIDTADRLTFAGAVVNETMRLRPVAPVIIVEPLEDTVLDNVRVPAKTAIFLVTRPAALDPARFADPDEFHPPRWLEEQRATPHDPSASFPFGSGPRVCPGRSLALLEMKVVLAMMYRNFEVIRDGEAGDVREELSLTMAPRGLRIRVRRRSSLSDWQTEPVTSSS